MKKNPGLGRKTVEREVTRRVKSRRGTAVPERIRDDELGAVSAGRDAQSGLASGRRGHKPLVVTKELDSSTPTIFH